MIIDETQLMNDSVSILTEHFEISEEKVVRMLTDDVMAEMVERMWRAQETYIQELAVRNYNETRRNV